MKIFISWSGEPSRTVALALKDWLESLIQRVVDCWVSADDIEAGERWSQAIDGELSRCDFGIICVTRANQLKPWIQFEAGAISKKVEIARVIPYLIGMTEADLQSSPLTRFQYKTTSKGDTLALVRSINNNLGDDALDGAVLERTFEIWWPQLDQVLQNLPQPIEETPSRPIEEVLEEVLGIVRALRDRAMSSEERNRSAVLNRLVDVESDRTKMVRALYNYSKTIEDLSKTLEEQAEREAPILLQQAMQARRTYTIARDRCIGVGDDVSREDEIYNHLVRSERLYRERHKANRLEEEANDGRGTIDRGSGT